MDIGILIFDVAGSIVILLLFYCSRLIVIGESLVSPVFSKEDS